MSGNPSQRDLTVVFGGSGFLGRAVAARLRTEEQPVRVAVRHPDAGAGNETGIETVAADVRDGASVAAALAGARRVVNAVGLYRERGGETFAAVHVEGAGRVAEAAARAGAEALVHVSGIGVDPASPSAYVRARAAGETAVRAAFPAATILRPSVLFGPGDSFLNSLARTARLLPAFPLFGDGAMRLQPVFVDDLAAAVSRALESPEARGRTYELGGGRAYSYRALIELLMRETGTRRPLLPLPFGLWETAARLTAWLPSPPVTLDQLALVKQDNLPDPGLPGFGALGIAPTDVEEMLPRCLGPAGPSS